MYNNSYTIMFQNGRITYTYNISMLSNLVPSLTTADNVSKSHSGYYDMIGELYAL